MSFGLLGCGMAHSFPKDHHLNANLKIHRTQKAGPMIKPLGRLEDPAPLDFVPRLCYINKKSNRGDHGQDINNTSQD
jgi:hypothetical protein